MDASNEYVCLTTGKILQSPTFDFDRPVEYPSDYFLDQNNKKPEITINLNPESSLQTTRSWAYGFLAGEKIGPSVVIQYLYHLYDTIKETLATPWVSYTVTIPAGEVTPLTLLNIAVNEVATPIFMQNPLVLDEDADLYLTIMLMGLYRYIKTHERYQTTISSKVASVVSPFAPSPNLIQSLENHNANGSLIMDNTDFEKMGSVLDMFLERFPGNKFAKARIGSIILRYQGCSAIADLKYLSDILGMESIGNAFEWLFAKSIAKE